MEDFVIDACCWHVEAEDPRFKKRALEHFRARYTILLEFYREQQLLRDPEFGLHVHHWSDFEIRKSDLTPEGFELFNWCLRKWNPAFGEAHTDQHLTPWKRRLSRMRRAA
ncbi:MAG: hypothetical protein OEM49_09140 [Myxococcales bacterium]|nr:hypothetical protein [Myxococcales bacterium]MDH5305957.1 hypothetical protein [Myxococcales bacterium]MDH5567356.1 hypothetical protein [Myxococcales bacterium]